MNPIDIFIQSTVKCTRCNKQGYMNCDCWEKCACGWTKAKGEQCKNKDCEAKK